MVVGIDLRCLPIDGSEGAGVAHAARALCSRLVEDRTIEWIAYVPKGASFPVISTGTKWSGEIVELVDASSKALRRAIKSNPCDVLFVPSGAVSLGINVPAVPWVHDLIIFDHPEWFNQKWLQRMLTTKLFLRGIRRAPFVFAVSEYTKKAIIKHAKISAGKVMITYEGGDENLSDPNSAKKYCQNKFGIQRPFVLALGTIEPRKNLAMLIRAWKASSLDLVIAGQDGWKMQDVEKEILKLNQEQKTRFHRLPEITDEDKRQLLAAAEIVAVPSLDEGFGLVALEALQAGTDVIASNRGALPEVVGNAGILLDPLDEKAWSQTLASPVKAGEGSYIDQKFSLEKTAEVVSKGLKSLDKMSKRS